MGKRALLLEEDGAAGEGEQLTLRVNEEYAKRFEHNKRREELHRLQEKHPEVAARLARQGGTAAARQAQAAGGEEEFEESSSSEDDNDDDVEALAADTDKVLETLARIRRHDPAIYDKDEKFFSSDDEGDEEGEDQAANGTNDGARRKARPLYLRDAIAQQALEGGEASSSDDENEGRRQSGQQASAPTYTQEQQQLKQAFLAAAGAADAGAEGGSGDEGLGGGLLKKRRREAAAAKVAGVAGRKRPINELLDEVFGGRGADEGDSFLKSYILNKGWVDGSGDATHERVIEGLGGDELDQEGEEGGEPELEEDEEFLDRAEEFEAAYNFRFEEPGGAKIVSHPRVIEGTVRKEDDRRKRARKEKAERKAAEEEQRAQEIRRLKNLKMGEIQDKLAQIQAVAGKSAPQQDLMDALLDDDWDPDKYDAAMAAAFNDEYYDAADEDDAQLVEELAHDDEGDKDIPEGADGFKAVRQRLLQQAGGASEGMGTDDGPGEDEGDDGEAGELHPEEVARQRAELQAMMEEYYKLDYEDNIGGLQCRFRYREVPKATGGLSMEDILTLPDKELNQVIGLKKLAPYREDGAKVRPNYKALQSIKGAASGEAAPAKPWHKSWKGHKERQAQQEGQGKQQWQQGKAAASEAGKQGGKQKWGAAYGKRQEQQKQRGAKPQQHKQTQQQQQQTRQKQPQPQPITEEGRLKARQESYAKLTLKKGDAHQQEGSKKRKRPDQSQQPATEKQPSTPAAADTATAGLTKAQKKNLKRALKRAQGKTSAGA